MRIKRKKEPMNYKSLKDKSFQNAISNDTDIGKRTLTVGYNK